MDRGRHDVVAGVLPVPARRVARWPPSAPLLPEVSARKVEEEIAWTDHAAAIEEGVAGRDDLRASLGQAYVVRRCTELAAEIHRRFAIVLGLESRIGRRTGTLLHAVLAAHRPGRRRAGRRPTGSTPPRW